MTRWKMLGLSAPLLVIVACAGAADGGSPLPLTEALSVSAAGHVSADAADKAASARGGSGGGGGSGGIGTGWTLVKNWDFGTDSPNTITSMPELSAEFQYHDQWNTIANGTNYGAVIVAASPETAIKATDLNLPDGLQPVDNDAARPFRELTPNSLVTYVRPLKSSQTTATVSLHDAGCGSIVAKWSLPRGGSLLGQDVMWETKLRMPNPLAGYWLAIWNSGVLWEGGPEMDVMESFGTPNINADAFHSNTVGGRDRISYTSWPTGLTSAGVPTNDRDLRVWHTWTLVYRKDDSYDVFYDGYRVQYGTLRWATTGKKQGATDMHFLIDLGWGHTGIQDVNISLPASSFPIRYEIDYTRVYTR